MGGGYLVTLLLAGGGLFLLGLAARTYGQMGERVGSRVVVAGVLGSILLVGSILYLRFARKVVREYDAKEAERAELAKQPWKLKREWQGGAIESKTGGSAALIWFFAVFWNALSWPGVWALFTGQIKDKAGWFILLFPLIGLGLLWGAIYQTVRWRKFGRVRFVPSTMPGSIGGYLGGVIEVPARVALEKDARLALRCVRRVTTGSGKNRHTSETVIWEREERIPADKWLSGPGQTTIPVMFYIPAECEPWDDDDANNQVVWRLAAEAAVPGVDFAVTFDVPVFRTGETAPPPEPGAPLLEAYQTTTLENVDLRTAGIERSVDRWRFGSPHLWGTRLVTSLIALGLLVLLGVFWGNNVNWVVWVVAGMFAGVMLLVALDLWFDGFELRLAGEGLIVRKSRPWGAKEWRVPRAEVAAVRAEKSMSSGDRQYHRLVLVGRAGADPRMAHPAETFAVRKLRYQLRRAGRELAVDDPEKMGEPGRELLEKLAAMPRFEIIFAKHVPGGAVLEVVKAGVLADVRRRRL